MSKRIAFDSFVSLFTLGQYSLELRQQEGRFMLQALSAGQPFDLPLLVDKYKTADWLVQFLGKQSGAYELGLAQLSTVKSILKADLDKQLAIHIDQEINNLEEIKAPLEWQLVWRWSYSRDGLVPESPISYHGDGWFLQGDRYWHLDGLLPTDAEWLTMPVISGKQLPEFLLTILNDWQERQLPFTSRVSISDDPVLRLTLRELNERRLRCLVEWREPSALIFALPDLPGYVLTGQAIRPGVALDRIAPLLSDDGQTIDLEGEDIPRFMQVLGPATVCFGTDQEQIMQVHRLYSEPVELVLAVQREEVNGLGSVQAVPMAHSGELHLPAEWLSRRLDGNEFLRVPSGWLSADAVHAGGIGRFGRALDGSALSPLTLTPEEILGRTSSRLAGPWMRIDFPSILLPVGETPEDNAELHLDFLMQYGVPGGIVGPVRQFGTLLLCKLASFTKLNPDTKALVVGTKTSLAVAAKSLNSVITARFDGGAADPPVEGVKGLVLATPRALDMRAGLAQQKWDILGILDADTLVKSKTTKVFRLLSSVHKELTLGLFALPDFYRSSSRGSALSQVFDLTDYGSLGQLWRYVVRNLQGKFPVFPKSIWPQQKEPPDALAEYSLPGIQEDRMPVPERSYYSYMPSMPRKQVEKFIKTANRLVHQEGMQTDYQFMAYYQPTYDYMTSEQMNWYLHWRSQVRKGKYPDTGMAYVILHAYELINSIGAQNVLDGYAQLRNLWLNYRRVFPLLDATLLGWASDYLLVNGCPIDPLEIYREAAELGASAQYADLLLGSYLSGGVGSVPLFLWEQLSDYQLRSSRFYGDGHAELLKEYIPRALEAIDQHLRANTGKGIFETWRPRRYQLMLHTPFQSAIYAKAVHPIRFGTYLPYTKHAPLRHFLTGVLKHSENKLRELKQFRGRLRGYALEPWVEAAIDQIVTAKSAPVAATPVRIDLGKVEQLTRESEKVRELLLKDQPDAQLVELDQEHRIQPISDETLLNALSEPELVLLKTLWQYAGAVPDDILHEQLPDQLLEPLVDHVNEVFLRHNGDLLITSVEGARLIIEAHLELLGRVLTAGEKEASLSPTSPDWLAEFPEEWIDFFSSLSDKEWQVLAACAGPEPAIGLRRVADQLGAMPELLLDELNDLALDAIGDILVHPGPELEEEYRPVVQKAMRSREEVV